ncbi:MAG: integration host factor subunit beta [Planctomycetota bacterium]|nr:integration host factor subunit beta [Planctomycetota bacterium]
MPTTTKKELIDRISARTGLRRNDVRETVQQFLDEVVNELAKGRRLEFRDFGVFEVKSRAPRVGQNPRTLERVQVPARKTVKFKPGRLMNAAFEVTTAAKRKVSPVASIVGAA